MSIEIRPKDFNLTDGMREHSERRLRFALDYNAGIIVFYESEVESLSLTTEEEGYPPGWAFF
jgi:hypothetical protein